MGDLGVRGMTWCIRRLICSVWHPQNSSRISKKNIRGQFPLIVLIFVSASAQFTRPPEHLHDFEGMEKTWSAIWSRSVQWVGRDLCSGPVWWRKRCSSNIDSYLRDGGHENQNRTFEFLQPEGCTNSNVRLLRSVYIYVYIYVLMHLCICSSMHLCIYASMHLSIDLYIYPISLSLSLYIYM